MSYDKDFELKRMAIHEEALKSAHSGNEIKVSSRYIKRRQGKETFSERLKREQRERNLSSIKWSVPSINNL